MNKKLCALLMLTFSLTVFAEEPQGQSVMKEEADKKAIQPNFNDDKTAYGTGEECNKYLKEIDSSPVTTPQEKEIKNQRMKQPRYRQCAHLRALSMETEQKREIVKYGKKETLKSSPDGKVSCYQKFSYTIDYEPCLKAMAAYNFVINSETFMNIQQQVRTDVKNSNLAKKANNAAASGDYQTGAFDAGIESNKHMKSIEAEKAAAYALAVGALSRAHMMIPDDDDAIKECYQAARHASPEEKSLAIIDKTKKTCEESVGAHKRDILANQDVKAALFEAITQFIAKGVAAGIKMNQYDTKAKAIAEAKKPFQEEETTDMMLELCQASPTDPACIERGGRTSTGNGFSAGSFSSGMDSGNNAFNMNPETSGEFGEVGAATNLDDKNEVASINSPFADDAKMAKDILNPAAAAQTQATGGAQGGGGGGAGGGMGGGGASLGSDLNGAEPEGEKEAQIKAGKVSGMYGSAGGGGYKGVSGGKDDKGNPFASLFDQKGNGGGVEEDRSIASGDIDGKASGLFQKISKRYNQIQADKRIEAKNLE